MTDRHRFGADELWRFLSALDDALTAPVSILIIGGAALSLQHGVQSTTRDIDLYPAVDTTIIDLAAEVARRASNLAVPIGNANVADLPYHYDQRVVALASPLGPWTRVTACTPDSHDLVLSKLLRGEETDLQQIRELHMLAPLDFETLCTRFVEEMYHAIGDKPSIISRFLLGIESLFGEMKRERAERRIRSAPAWAGTK